MHLRHPVSHATRRWHATSLVCVLHQTFHSCLAWAHATHEWDATYEWDATHEWSLSIAWRALFIIKNQVRRAIHGWNMPYLYMYCGLWMCFIVCSFVCCISSYNTWMKFMYCVTRLIHNNIIHNNIVHNNIVHNKECSIALHHHKWHLSCSYMWYGIWMYFIRYFNFFVAWTHATHDWSLCIAWRGLFKIKNLCKRAL